MKKIIRLLPLSILATPIVVISCGSSNENSTDNNGDASVDIPSVQDRREIELVEKSKIFTPEELNSTNPSSAYHKILPSAWATMEFSSYKISGVVSNDFYFNIDNRLDISEKDVHKLVDKFLAETNWGLGLTSFKNAFFTPETMSGAAGWGGEDSNILIKVNDTSDEQMQFMLDGLKHEYGHHETQARWTASVAADNLLSHNAPGSNVYDLTKQGVSMETKKNEMIQHFESLNIGTMEELFSNLIPNIQGNTRIDQFINWALNIDYTYNKYEYLNRVMTVLELTPWKSSEHLVDSFIAQNDIISYMSNDQNLIDLQTGNFTDNMKEIVDLYAEDVYGYNNDLITVNPFEVEGYSSKDFDFITYERANGIDEVEQSMVNKTLGTHFINKETFMGEITNIDTLNAHYAEINHGENAYPIIESSIKFYEDSNHNGTLEKTDNEVQVNFSYSAS